MIVEPAMMNCGVVLPQPGYLGGCSTCAIGTAPTWRSTK